MIDTLTISYTIGGQIVSTEDTEPDPGKTYMAEGYRTVIPNDYDSPVDNGWYEVVDESYILSSDIEPDPEKEYFEHAMMDVEPEPGDNPSELGWVESLEGETVSALEHAASLAAKEPQEIIGLDIEEHSVTAKGWATQRTTTGKNLLGISSLSSAFKLENRKYVSKQTDTRSYLDFYIFLNSGSTNVLTQRRNLSVGLAQFTLEIDNTVDSVSIKHNGLSADLFLCTNNPISLQPGTYTFSVMVEKADPTTVGGIVLTDLQLELGSTATSYEPYTGRAPSPSPDYPQEIKVARGRNLVDYTSSVGVGSRDGTDNVINGSASYSGGILTISYAYGQGGAILKGIGHLAVKAGETIVLSANIRCSGNRAFVGFGNYSGGGTNVTETVNLTANTWTHISKALTAGEDYDMGIFIQPYSTGTTLEVKELQLELGSIPTPYVPYGHVGLEVQGRNLLGPISFGIIDSTTGVDGVGRGDALRTGFIPVVPGDNYTMTILKACMYNKNRLYAVDGSYIGSSMLFSLDRVGVFTQTIPEGVYYIRFEFDENATTGFTTETTDFAMFERGSTANDYEPYFHETRAIPLPLKSDGERWAGGLPDGTADILSIDPEGRYEWTGETDEVVFDGSSDEPWGAVSGYENLFKIDNMIPDALKAKPNSLCSHFVRATGSASSVTSGQYKADISGGTNQRLIYKYADVSTVADWTTWLASNNITLLYPLATPTTESGYIDNWPVEIPEGSTITIPELEDVDVQVDIVNTLEQ